MLRYRWTPMRLTVTNTRQPSRDGCARDKKSSGGWLGSGADEGRGKQRNARGRRKQPSIPRFPNGNSYLELTALGVP